MGAVEGETKMKYEILDVAKLAENYAMYGWVVACDGDLKRAYTVGVEVQEDE